jgi:hypothetical protein
MSRGDFNGFEISSKFCAWKIFWLTLLPSFKNVEAGCAQNGKTNCLEFKPGILFCLGIISFLKNIILNAP